jgi:hypothetical protein
VCDERANRRTAADPVRLYDGGRAGYGFKVALQAHDGQFIQRESMSDLIVADDELRAGPGSNRQKDAPSRHRAVSGSILHVKRPSVLEHRLRGRPAPILDMPVHTRAAT